MGNGKRVDNDKMTFLRQLTLAMPVDAEIAVCTVVGERPPAQQTIVDRGNGRLVTVWNERYAASTSPPGAATIRRTGRSPCSQSSLRFAAARRVLTCAAVFGAVGIHRPSRRGWRAVGGLPGQTFAHRRHLHDRRRARHPGAHPLRKMSASWGQPVVVDNKPGAGGNRGRFRRQIPADGYTVVVGTVGTHSINPALYSKMPYDAVKDFAPVTLLATTPTCW